MIRTVRSVVVLVMLSALALGGPQVAARADTLPTVASGGGPSSGWAAIEWTLGSGAQGSLTILNSNVSGPGFASLYLYDASDRALAGGNVGITGNMGDVHVEASLPPAAPAEQTVTTIRSVPYGGQVTITFDNNLPPGTYKAIFVAGGNQHGWTWALNGNSAVSAPRATTKGSDVYAYSAKDFTGSLSTQVYAGGYSVSSMGAAANVGTQRSITAAHTLVGIGFLPGPLAAKADATMHGPGGQSQSCFCPLSDFRGPGAAGPGTWTFTYTAIGAGTSNMADGVLGAADAYLPEP
ncbi:MAG TPA: hypothetical protein VFA83_12345 [Acidimicrobiales bacterium]|nr:hypothetical protein [Acidimicrobiales bacterium]